MLHGSLDHHPRNGLTFKVGFQFNPIQFPSAAQLAPRVVDAELDMCRLSCLPSQQNRHQRSRTAGTPTARSPAPEVGKQAEENYRQGEPTAGQTSRSVTVVAEGLGARRMAPVDGRPQAERPEIRGNGVDLCLLRNVIPNTSTVHVGTRYTVFGFWSSVFFTV